MRHRCNGCRMKRKYGQENHPLYYRFKTMRNRCYSPKVVGYSRYGGRGIRVCERWDTFSGFLADMGESWRPGLFLDRIDNDGDYCPENCRWVTRKENNNNTRANRVVSFRGKRMTLSQWSDHLGINYRMLRVRLWRGWSIEDALSTPPLDPSQKKQRGGNS